MLGEILIHAVISHQAGLKITETSYTSWIYFNGERIKESTYSGCKPFDNIIIDGWWINWDWRNNFSPVFGIIYASLPLQLLRKIVKWRQTNNLERLYNMHSFSIDQSKDPLSSFFFMSLPAPVVYTTLLYHSQPALYKWGCILVLRNGCKARSNPLEAFVSCFKNLRDSFSSG